MFRVISRFATQRRAMFYGEPLSGLAARGGSITDFA